MPFITFLILLSCPYLDFNMLRHIMGFKKISYCNMSVKSSVVIVILESLDHSLNMVK